MRRPLNPNRKSDIARLRRDLAEYRNGKRKYPAIGITDDRAIGTLPRKAKKVVKQLLDEHIKIMIDRLHFQLAVDEVIKNVHPGQVGIALCKVGRNAVRLFVCDKTDDEPKGLHGDFWLHEVPKFLPTEGIQLIDGRSMIYDDGVMVPQGHLDEVILRPTNLSMVMSATSPTNAATAK